MKLLMRIVVLYACLMLQSYANPDPDGIGQIVQIYTQLHSFVGKPSWLIVIRDIDHDQNIPYVYDINTGDNFWTALTYGRNYLILASTLQIETYKPRTNQYRYTKIKNFCGLESNGRIIRGASLYVMVRGDITPNGNAYTCHVSEYTDANFTVVKPDSAEQ